MPKQRRARDSKRRSAWYAATSWYGGHVSIRGTVFALVLVVCASGGLWWWGIGGDHATVKRAAIVDQLSVTAANPEFVTAATQTLEQAGYRVDYFAGDLVTVEFYRHLPEQHYQIIVLRAHSGLTTVTNADTGQVTHTKSVSLFTSQPFDKISIFFLRYLVVIYKLKISSLTIYQFKF